jgi:hypothetical protein
MTGEFTLGKLVKFRIECSKKRIGRRTVAAAMSEEIEDSNPPPVSSRP